MSAPDERVLILAKAIAELMDVDKGGPGLRDPQQMVDSLKEANQRLNKAVAEVDTFEEMLEYAGDYLLDMVIQAATQYVKKAGPLGLAEAALKGVGQVADFLDGGK